jgi:hypothetical protein
MCKNNSFCGGCGNPMFNGKDVCRCCSLEILNRGFSSHADFDDWHETEFDQSEATEFDHELAEAWGESVKTVVQSGFQPRPFEAELSDEEVDLIFLAEEEAWRKQFHVNFVQQRNLGA